MRPSILRDVIRYGFELCVIAVLLAAVLDLRSCAAGATIDPVPVPTPTLQVQSTETPYGVILRSTYGAEVCYFIVTEMGGMAKGHQGAVSCR